MRDEIIIRRADSGDADAIWSLFAEVVAAGGAFLEDGTENREQVLRAWLSPPAVAFVALLHGTALGAYKLRPNHPGYGSHIANGSYMVAEAARGRGVGRMLGDHSIRAAREMGYSAIQFNAVISTNERAVALWYDLGFRVIGRVPSGFRHPTWGDADLLIMHRTL